MYGGRNGVNPVLFRERAVVGKIMDSLPASIANFQNDSSILRCLCYGPPGSGKTSIMGKLDEALRARFPSTPVYFVRCAELRSLRRQLTMQLAIVPTCVVLVDDAQEWYGEGDRDFFALFKNTNRLLVAAATYSVEQFNKNTPVEFQLREKSNLHPEEIRALLINLHVHQDYHAYMQEWFGDNYGRFHLLVPQLITRWDKLKATSPSTTLADTFFRAETMQDPAGARLLPSLSQDMRKILKLFWMGKIDREQNKKLVRYGVFNDDGTWSCDYVRRKYFRDLFHSSSPDLTHFDETGDGLPHELALLKKGFEGLNWVQLKNCPGSSNSGFPIEDIWQAEFYGSIGRFIPRHLTFCKEYVARTVNRVDFVLRNGSTRAIEFLIKSSDVGGHHRRFENGSYSALSLTGSYLVVDIKPWGKMPDLDDVSDGDRLAAATACFAALTTGNRRRNHAVFLISNDLSSGILYTYHAETESAVEYARSPPLLLDMDVS